MVREEMGGERMDERKEGGKRNMEGGEVVGKGREGVDGERGRLVPDWNRKRLEARHQLCENVFANICEHFSKHSVS